MDFFVWSGLYSFIANLLIGLFVYTRNPRKPVNIFYALFSLTVSGWSFGSFLENVISEKHLALNVLRCNYLFAVWLPSLYVHFVYAFTGSHSRSCRLKLCAAYFVSCILSPIVFTPLFVEGLRIIQGTNFYISLPGPLYYVFFAFFGLGMCEVLYHTLNQLFKSSGRQKTQLKYITIANAIAIFAGFEYFSRVFGFFTSPPLDDYILVVYLLVVAYAIVRHQLMDIEVIIRRTLVFAGLFSFAFGIFAFTTFLSQELLSAYLSGRAARILSLLLSVFLIILAYDPLRTFLINLTDRFLFQKKYDYRKLLRDASAGISQIKSLHQLLSLVTHFVTMRIRVRNAAVLIHDEKNDYFKVAYLRGYQNPLTLTLSPEERGNEESFSRGREEKDEKSFPEEKGGSGSMSRETQKENEGKGESWFRKGHIFNEKDPLINYLARERIALDIERVKEYIETGGPKKIKGVAGRGRMIQYDYKAIETRMEDLQAACCIPSFLGERLRNVLILGEKKSGDFYSDEDLNVLFTLAQESAIAIENARLYDQAIEKAKELEVINTQLNTAQTNLLRALNDTEVANKKLRDTHAQLIHEQKMATLGRLASSVGHEVNNPLTILSMNVSRAILKYRRDPDLKVTEILDIFQKMEQNISRIKAVVNTLTGLLKKSERGKFEALSLKLVLEETLPLVQFQTYLENLSGTEVIFDIPPNLPLIKGDLERLQEVFLNLFINAYHAMAGKHRDRKITVTASESPTHPARVLVEFSDNGIGMSDDVMRKVFSYGFTTKPTGKGSGMGLYMCRYIIELHGGEIKVRSKAGEGTTFVITLPIYYEPTSLATGESVQS